MDLNTPSTTALRVALRRAAHQLLDQPLVFADPMVLQLLGLAGEIPQDYGQDWLAQTPLARVLRASLAARSQFAEEMLRAAHARGVDQMVLLGAGSDTFAFRAADLVSTLRIFEVDHPATQAWKRQRLSTAALPHPPNLTFVPVNFENQHLKEKLRRAGFDFARSAFFSWLGVSMYLSLEAVATILRLVASLPPGSAIVFDYLLSPELLPPKARQVFDGLVQRVHAAGEPFQTFFEPEALTQKLREMGYSVLNDLGPEQMDGRYFQGRTDGLRAGRLAHVLHAQV